MAVQKEKDSTVDEAFLIWHERDQWHNERINVAFKKPSKSERYPKYGQGLRALVAGNDRLGLLWVENQQHTQRLYFSLYHRESWQERILIAENEFIGYTTLAFINPKKIALFFAKVKRNQGEPYKFDEINYRIMCDGQLGPTESIPIKQHARKILISVDQKSGESLHIVWVSQKVIPSEECGIFYKEVKIPEQL